MAKRTPTADELAGMAWWNNLTERERGTALQLAKANTVAEAWDWQKSVVEAQEGPAIGRTHGAGWVSKEVNDRSSTGKASPRPR